jgi:hypothetical protein
LTTGGIYERTVQFGKRVVVTENTCTTCEGAVAIIESAVCEFVFAKEKLTNVERITFKATNKQMCIVELHQLILNTVSENMFF